VLPTLPISLEKLVLEDCKSIIESPMIPPHLKELEVYNCDQIKFIGSDDVPLEGIGIRGKMPTSLKMIILEDLKELTWIGKLPPNLETLSINHCNAGELVMSSLPNHLNNLTIEGI
jgi:hypothetical protein